ncbi:uncharacterized protein LOC144161973 [Haemaphysalis longicornis]
MRDLVSTIFATKSLAGALGRVAIRFGIDAYFSLRFRTSARSFPRIYFELDFPDLVIHPENLLPASFQAKAPDMRLLKDATVEMLQTLGVPLAEHNARADAVAQMVTAVCEVSSVTPLSAFDAKHHRRT